MERINFLDKIKEKRLMSEKIIASTSKTLDATSISTALLPDAAILVPIQVNMLREISMVFDLDLSESFLKALISSATTKDETIMSKLVKRVAPTITTIYNKKNKKVMTLTIGEVYIDALATLFEANKGEPPTEEEIQKMFILKLCLKK